MTDPHWINTRRGALPKRLLEAWVAQAVGRLLPDALLWATNYREEDGIGYAPQAGSILLQCSWAGPGRRGISTRVRKRSVFAFFENEWLRPWLAQAYFVLVGPPDLDRAAEPGSPLALWAVPVDALAEFIEAQGRGTIAQEGLASLAEEAALPLADLLDELARRPPAPRLSHPPIPKPPHGERYPRHPLDFSAPRRSSSA